LEFEVLVDRQPVSTDQAPAAIGPYSQAIRTDGYVFCSGQLGLDPATGKLVEGGVEAQTRRALINLKAVLTGAGSSLAGVVKTTIFLADMADFPKVNAVYGEVFAGDPPARSTVQVAALPLGGLVEIEAIALLS
jgi:2-iminobutanoate/2-iminopropanoate deaminase